MCSCTPQAVLAPPLAVLAAPLVYSKWITPITPSWKYGADGVSARNRITFRVFHASTLKVMLVASLARFCWRTLQTSAMMLNCFRRCLLRHVSCFLLAMPSCLLKLTHEDVSAHALTQSRTWGTRPENAFSTSHAFMTTFVLSAGP